MKQDKGITGVDFGVMKADQTEAQVGQISKRFWYEYDVYFLVDTYNYLFFNGDYFSYANTSIFTSVIYYRIAIPSILR